MDLSQLDGEQKGRLSDALLDAFTKSGLKRLLRWTMQPPRRLDSYEQPEGGLENTVFELIEASVREGWTPELVRAARKQNQDNKLLREFAEDWGIEASTQAQPVGQRPQPTPVGDPSPTGGQESDWPAPTPGHVAWLTQSGASPGEARADTPIRFERMVARALQQTTLVSDSQQLYIRLSKTTEQLLRYQTQLARGAVDGHWQLITFGLDDALSSLTAIHQKSIGVLEGKLVEDFERDRALLCGAIVEARRLGPDQLAELRWQLLQMRTASVDTRATMKKQLEATLKRITSERASGQLDAQTGLLLVTWDRAFRQYELWDKCWQMVVATEGEATGELWTLLQERVWEAAQASDDLRDDIEAWLERAMFERDLRGPAEALSWAIEAVKERQKAPVEIRLQEFKPLVGEVNAAARTLANVLLRVVNQWIEHLVDATESPLGTVRGAQGGNG